MLPCPATNSPHWPLPLATGFPGERWVKEKDCKCLMVGEEETHLYIGPDNPRHENRETATNNNLLSETEVLDVNVPVS